MSGADVSLVVRELEKALTPLIEERITRDIESEMRKYRQSISTKERWCCEDMQSFAIEIWGASVPRGQGRESLGQMSYKLRDRFVNWCPFCGVKIS